MIVSIIGFIFSLYMFLWVRRDLKEERDNREYQFSLKRELSALEGRVKKLEEK